MLKIFLVLENLAEPNCTENLTLKNLRFVPFGGQSDIPGVPSQDQGCQIWHLIWVRLAPYGTNLVFLRSVSVHFGSLSQNVLKLILKSQL